nr:MAG TPA: hypothetical protein [Caudoviricetes sp.]
MRPSCPVLWLSCQGAMSLYKQPQEKSFKFLFAVTDVGPLRPECWRHGVPP